MTDLREEPLTLFDAFPDCVTVRRADLERVLAAYRPVTAGDEAAYERLLDITEPGWADA